MYYLKFGPQAKNHLFSSFTPLPPFQPLPPPPHPPAPLSLPSPASLSISPHHLPPLSLPPPLLSHLLGLLDRLCFGDEDGDGRGELEGEEPSLDLSPPSFGLPCLLLPRPLFERSMAAALGLADLTFGDRSEKEERERGWREGRRERES